MIRNPCAMCGAMLEGDDLESYGYAGLAHVRAEHSELPFPDIGVRNFFESDARMTGGSERLDDIGPVTVERVTDDRLDDWASFFDFDAMAGIPQNGACYCLEPHELKHGEPLPEFGHWTQRRATMLGHLRSGHAFGYLAYAGATPAGWVNASMRGDYRMHRRDDDADSDTVAIACFVVSPPHRRHHIASQLLARVVADAPGRGARAVEAYPLKGDRVGSGFRGDLVMFEAAGFSVVRERAFDVVVRLDLSSGWGRRALWQAHP